jgi:condensin complex subunit 2
MSKTFDEGGAKGLLLANLGVGESSCHIVFDSSASDVVDYSIKGQDPVRSSTAGDKTLHRVPEGPMDVSTLIAKLGSLLSEHRADDDWDLDSTATSVNDLRNVPLVPQLSSLRAEHEKLVAAGCCGPDAAIALASTIGPKTPAGKVRHYHADSQQEQDADFSIHQEAIERSQRKMDVNSALKFSPATALFRNRWSNDGSTQENVSPSNNFSMDDDGGGGFMHDDGVDDDDHCFDNFIANARYSDVSLPNTSGQPPAEPPAEATLFTTDQQASTVASFIDNIAAGVTVLSGNDYEYFSSSNLPRGDNSNVWAGATHWKRNDSNKPKGSKETLQKKATKSKSKKVAKRKTKEEPLVDFTSNSAPDVSFLWKDSTKRKGSTASTQLSKAMISKFTDEENILPIDLGFANGGDFGSLQQLTTLFLRPKVSILRSLSSGQANVMPRESAAEMKKTVEFQLPTTLDHFNDDEDNDGPGFDFGADDDDDEFLVPELENVRKVNKVRVGYATVAKKVDVKRLKRDLWQELESRFGQVVTTTNTKTMDDTEENEIEEVDRIDGDDPDMVHASEASEKEETPETVISFQDAVRTLGEQQAQGDITLPFYFICILHLANEKGLRLEQGEVSFSNDINRIEQHQNLLSDFFIHQN